MHGKRTSAAWTALALLLPLAVGAAGALQLPGAATGPGPSPPDRFHPERDEPAPPRRGGRVAVHLESPPISLNGLIESAGVTWRLLYELHAFLVRPDWETWEPRGVLAERWTLEDEVELADGRVLRGAAERAGGRTTVRPADGEPVVVDDGEVRAVRPGTILTLHLRRDAVWHDGHPFDAGDVMFTFRCTKNPHVRCDAYRFLFDKLARAERLDDHTVRFHLERPYFNVLNGILYQFTVLPAHVYDLGDPDHPAPEPDASDERQGRYVNEHPANLDWIGLGPYRLVRRDDRTIEAERFEDYFDPDDGGYLDAVRWRVVRGDQAAFQALLEGELDFTARVPSEDFFGERTRSEPFLSRYYKGWFYTPRMSYTVWNTARTELADERVRRALGMSFDWDEFVRSFFKGLGQRVTSEVYAWSPNYDRAVEPLRFDLGRARSLLAEAGWYDRDGDGRVDKDGAPLELELLTIAGSESSAVYAQRLQENLEELGVRLEIAARDYPTFAERVLSRDFDAAHWAWFMPVLSDPEQMWHSRWVGANTSNHGSLADPEADRLIEAIQVELDPEVRRDLFHELHRLLYRRQVYMYGITFPQKFAMSKRVRNFQTFAIEPGYSIRRWYLAE